MQPVIKIAKYQKRKLKLLGPETAQLGQAQRASSLGGQHQPTQQCGPRPARGRAGSPGVARGSGPANRPGVAYPGGRGTSSPSWARGPARMARARRQGRPTAHADSERARKPA